ncbi:MAG TPA: methyltransferase domain-containing protein, partial [Chitinispirillaceae bacterium]|nr:methyltransferase domain-containing protein [Chitinispirillaceae bacterium]
SNVLSEQVTYCKMNIKTGDIVLDLGCGPGIDTIQLAQLVGESGFVYGIDMDEEMIAIADKEGLKAGVNKRVFHQTGTVQQLPFNEEFFDSCRAERLFQVIPKEINRGIIFSEIKRVLKADGTLVLTDVDWGSASIDFPDIGLERKLVTFFASRMRPDGFAGRAFRRQFIENGFKNITCEVETLITTKLEESPFGAWLTGCALDAGVITKAEADFWLETLMDKNKNNKYFSTVSSIIVTGRKSE